MNQASNTGDDEPTVIGHRPVAVGRNGAVPDGARATAPILPVDPAMPLRPAPSNSAPSSPQPVPGLLAELPLSADASRPEELIAAAATPLLALAAQLRQSVDYADVTALRTETVAQIKKFDERAIKLGARVSDVSAARYVLCSLLDETVMTTPWGAASNWSTHSLLNQFHGETWGGEKVFAILDRVRANPPQRLALLKLIDLCLAFGFEGKYRVMEGGQYQLEELRDELGRLWRSHVKALPEDLSPQWQGVSVRRKLRAALPLWVLFAVAGALLLGIYGLFAFRLDQGLKPIEQRFERIGVPRI
ncbi:type IVB secretion system protein IcmH/DotU [Ancylobacter amanitiformis]|uniref:Type VI secretion system protein ImpK n=1 Tax=Ancylobacter amanitiformis TaxID=217069 RepID=A0ABU0LL68_9HYPH|nr:type IVB secretion system protein IcmH/DotU [Ancylobacter amanitiformis]MDQ0509452.1 type VI secretion system protein ImpK [Ancylobacter amanitiformis]